MLAEWHHPLNEDPFPPSPTIALPMGRFCRPEKPQAGDPRPPAPQNPADGPILPTLEASGGPKLSAGRRIGTICTPYLCRAPAPHNPADWPICQFCRPEKSLSWFYEP